MIHAKSHGNRPNGSGEEDFLNILTYIGTAAILVMCPALFQHIFISMYLEACIQNLVQNSPKDSEKSLF